LSVISERAAGTLSAEEMAIWRKAELVSTIIAKSEFLLKSFNEKAVIFSITIRTLATISLPSNNFGYTGLEKPFSSQSRKKMKNPAAALKVYGVYWLWQTKLVIKGEIPGG